MRRRRASECTLAPSQRRVNRSCGTSQFVLLASLLRKSARYGTFRNRCEGATMAQEFELIRSVNRRLLSDIARKREEGFERVQTLSAQITELKNLLEQLDYQRSQIEASEKLQAAFLQGDLSTIVNTTAPEPVNDGNSDGGEPDDADRGKLKARIGGQRYIVLQAIRDAVGLTLNGAIHETGLPPKRVKDAIRADIELGVLKEVEYSSGGVPVHVFVLTDVGLDLLGRFENYKRQRGQKPPNKIDVLRDMGIEPPEDAVLCSNLTQKR